MFHIFLNLAEYKNMSNKPVYNVATGYVTITTWSL